MEAADTSVITKNCINSEPAPCSGECPFSLDVREFIQKAAKGRWNSAYKQLRGAVLFPLIVSALCPAPCEGVCLRLQTNSEPVAIRALEEACVRLAKNTKPDRYVIPAKPNKIAVVGGGIAGLSAALYLAQKNYPVTLYEKDNRIGGALRSDPRFEEFLKDIYLGFSATDIEFKLGEEIRSPDALSGFDLVYVATGEGGNDFSLLRDNPRNPQNLPATGNPKAFIGGGLRGSGFSESIAEGKDFSKIAESYLQTGKLTLPVDIPPPSPCRIDCSGFPPAPIAAPSEPSGFSDTEAKSEAARCLMCDCEKCMTDCEMLGMYRKKPKKIAVEVYTDTKATPPYSTHTLTRQAYSCNMCGHCSAVCPEDISIGELLHMSRVSRAQSENYPAAFHDYWLREMDFATAEASFCGSADVRAPQYLFFPGCSLGAHNPEYVYKSFDFLKERFNTGIFLRCCGAPAYWAGDEERFQANIDRIRKNWTDLEKPAFIFACATCESVMARFLPEIARVSLYELLARRDDIKPVKVFSGASVFDPCSARDNSEMQTAVRLLASGSGAVITEPGEKNRCCGFGGHMRLANPPLYEKITENRSNSGPEPYFTYCANCSEVFIERGKECAHILDAVFNIPRLKAVPRIDEKHSNSMNIKRKMYKMLSGTELPAEKKPWDGVELRLCDELADSIDRKLISLEIIREAIWRAEENDDKFIREDGVCQCGMEKSALTYWVQYIKADGGVFEVYDAYYHRMSIGE